MNVQSEGTSNRCYSLSEQESEESSISDDEHLEDAFPEQETVSFGTKKRSIKAPPAFKSSSPQNIPVEDKHHSASTSQTGQSDCSEVIADKTRGSPVEGLPLVIDCSRVDGNADHESITPSTPEDDVDEMSYPSTILQCPSDDGQDSPGILVMLVYVTVS